MNMPYSSSALDFASFSSPRMRRCTIRTLGLGTPPPSANVSFGRSTEATIRVCPRSHLRIKRSPGLFKMLRGSTMARKPPRLTYFRAPSTNNCSAGISRRVSLLSSAGRSYRDKTCGSSICALPPNGGLVTTMSNVPCLTFPRATSSSHSPGAARESPWNTLAEPSPCMTRFICVVRTKNGLISMPTRFRSANSLTRTPTRLWTSS